MAGLFKQIIQLPRQIADRIAAGEVVDRPVSIVKELVENSIDAGSTSIVVEIRKGGKSYIRVTDNGSGIASHDTETAFQRHATSKIREVSDLDAIKTLGFRGEALASIAAVSRTELITKTEEERAGSYILLEGGMIADRTEKGCPSGTTVIVRDLFYNTPARLKFMKSDNTEGALVIDLVSKIALAYPEIRVRLINNNNTLFTTPGKGDRLSAIATIYDPHLAGILIRSSASSDENGLQLEGYISPPDETRKNRRNQIFFVNGRYIQSKVLEEAVSEAYRSRMFEGRYPVVFLFLKVNPELTDVNVHPNKKEIRFDNDDLIREFVTDALKRSLTKPEAVPEIRFTEDKKKSSLPETDEGIQAEESPSRIKSQKPEQLDIHAILRTRRAEEERAEYKAPFNEKGQSPAENPSISVFSDATAQSASNSTVSEQDPVPPPADIPFDVSAIRPIGVIFNEYILGSDKDSFYMIDQHAAHERILYEKLTGKFYRQLKSSQLLAVPLTIKTTFAAGTLVDQWMKFLIKIGFAIEEFGQRTYLVREIPAYMDLEEAETFLRDITEQTKTSASFSDSAQRDRIVARSCKAAVKANDRLSMEEIQSLLRDLSACRNPFSCPHGRPTIIRMKHNEIDRMFKR